MQAMWTSITRSRVEGAAASRSLSVRYRNVRAGHQAIEASQFPNRQAQAAEIDSAVRAARWIEWLGIDWLPRGPLVI